MNEFEIGDLVQILTKDGATFSGVLQEFDWDSRQFVIISGYGFPLDDIVHIVPA